MSTVINIIFSFCFLLVSTSCTPEEETHEPPVFKTSIPENEATDVSIEASVEIVFDEVIMLSDPHNITINGKKAKAEASFTKVLIKDELEKETTYSIEIPKTSVINTYGLPLQNDVKITFTTEVQIEVALSQQLVTPNPSTEAVNVYNFLLENYGKKLISSSVANGAWDINEAEWAKYHTGKYPAMATMDYIFLEWSPANWIDYTKMDIIKDWWNNNGILSAGWHWNVPPNPMETDISKFTFRTETSFKPSNVPIEGTWENEVAKGDFDKLIDYIKLLQNENIPLIWRPLHEAAGNIYEYNNGKAWFWWGTDGGEAYVALWQYLFNYFKDAGINNLIWVWTTQTKDNDFYPGDEYVDLIGKDIYNDNDANSNAMLFKTIQETYPNKMITLSECGNVATLSEQWNKGGKWSWFMPWCDHDRTRNINSTEFTKTDHEYANATWWINAMEQDYVITRDEMPSLK